MKQCKITEKESIDLNKVITILGGEENLLGKYIEHGRSFGWMDNYDVIHVDDTVWPKISGSPQYVKKKEMDRISRGWDSMIERAHEGTSKYERLARELARSDRFTRRVLSEAFMEAYAECCVARWLLGTQPIVFLSRMTLSARRSGDNTCFTQCVWSRVASTCRIAG